MDRPRRLTRKRINDLLSVIYEFPLTIVEAPAGYGKTTAVNDFLSKHSERHLWISFQKIKESAEYWRKFIAGLSKMCGDGDSALKNMDYPSDAPQRSKLLTILNKVDFVQPAIVVLDNYELVKDHQLTRLLLEIVEDEIENLHLVILTRDTTEIDFVSLLSKRKCYVISQQQMKFTAEEVRDYCVITNNSVSRDEIEKITDYTGGWISMIYIILFGMKEHIPVGLNSTIDELIEKTLFKILDTDSRHFLMQLSVMDSFTIRQAAFVTDNKNAGGLLKSLQKKNAFIYFDNQDRKFKIHPILLDFLGSRQDFSKGEQKELYCRLGQWHLQHNELLEAYTYLARAGEVNIILTHLNNPVPIRNLYTDFEGADELFASVTRKLLFDKPIAYLRYLFYSVLKQKKSVIENLEECIAELETYYIGKKDINETQRNHILAEILCVRKFTVFNRLAEMHTYNDKIIGLLNGHQSYIMLNVNEFTFGSPHYLYIYFRDAGSLKEITAISQRNAHVDFSDGCGMGSDSLATAEYACETGNFYSAILESQKAVYKAETKSQWSVIICAKFNMTRAALALGKIGTAREILRQLCDDAEKLNRSVYSSMAQLCRGYVYSLLGMSENIPLWLKNGDLSSLNMFFGGLGFDKLVYGKALLAQGEYLKIEALSDSFYSSFSIFQNRLGFIHNTILLAAAKFHLYGVDEALPVLFGALEMAKPDEIVLPFAECAVHLLPILKAMEEKHKFDAFTNRVSFACAQYAENLSDVFMQSPELTEREKDVLILLADGLSRKEIADSLIIAPATVKRHLEDIYRKLEVNGKAAAVKAAWIKGLL
ncbi:helix-turn-helix transcriptional regulator [Clostridium oryzae]|uniref:HTH-type transcriptional regulator MalT n=1 Tax=Clostridium oryzae TaxID=1450648 RepID=A0A1V4IWF4_9CLOT|nr:LuxR C-terminal-related transcriptional regulator [Clostridium oryzae]OPJ64378.1 HTH-type transcriptional regulator MalT [Clostridium oryzae]